MYCRVEDDENDGGNAPICGLLHPLVENGIGGRTTGCVRCDANGGQSDVRLEVFQAWVK
jgi:hypothetical protein